MEVRQWEFCAVLADPAAAGGVWVVSHRDAGAGVVTPPALPTYVTGARGPVTSKPPLTEVKVVGKQVGSAQSYARLHGGD